MASDDHGQRHEARHVHKGTLQERLRKYIPLRCGICGLPLADYEGERIGGLTVCQTFNCISDAHAKAHQRAAIGWFAILANQEGMYD